MTLGKKVVIARQDYSGEDMEKKSSCEDMEEKGEGIGAIMQKQIFRKRKCDQHKIEVFPSIFVYVCWEKFAAVARLCCGSYKNFFVG